MVRINYCPSCGSEIVEKSFICPKCSLDIEELFAKGYLLASNNKKNSIELFKGSEEIFVLDDEEDSDLDEEIVIVVPQDSTGDELVINFDKLGIDVENLCENVNIVIEVEGADFENNEEFSQDGEYITKPNQWFFDDDPYGIVYYEFINDDWLWIRKSHIIF